MFFLKASLLSIVRFQVFSLSVKMFFSISLLLGLSALTQVTSAHSKPETVCDDAQLGAVASESSVCSYIGIDVLKRGGNAADAVGSTNCS
jgi:hypothetical protein